MYVIAVKRRFSRANGLQPLTGSYQKSLPGIEGVKKAEVSFKEKKA
ncbi:hypothetical protein BMS3Abin07_01338 [bacterium BMS3Abin07]|nr:hypothetical protein BMS3Abin07_01338 [bacterium BMS3Abin07]GBE33068.1 hypothetical protein BMS3Bbin05_02003 [bacterium BMS3Bbin05]